jgi:hypothetical protein
MVREEAAWSGPRVLKALHSVKEVFHGRNDADPQKIPALARSHRGKKISEMR